MSDTPDDIPSLSITGNDWTVLDDMTAPLRAGNSERGQGPYIPCQIDGSPVAATLRGFGHGWQGQHNSTNSVVVETGSASIPPIGFLTSAGTFSVDLVMDGSPTVRTTGCVGVVYGWDEYNHSLAPDLHHPLRAKGQISTGVVLDETEETDMAEQTTLAVRRLTPRECERLMGWPDDWTRYGDNGRELGDTHRYRMCGNGVVSNVAEWIGRRLPDVSGGADD